MIDLEALLLTRRFFNTVMDDCHLVVRCQLSNLLKRPEGGLFGQVSTILFSILYLHYKGYFCSDFHTILKKIVLLKTIVASLKKCSFL